MVASHRIAQDGVTCLEASGGEHSQYAGLDSTKASM
jgi:hypothetical protein